MRVDTVVSGIRAGAILPVAALVAAFSVAPRPADAALIDIFLIAGQSGPSSATSAPFSFTTTSVYRLGDLNSNFLATSVSKVDNFSFDVGGALSFDSFFANPDRIDTGEPGTGTAALVDSEIGTWDDVGIPGSGDLSTTLNIGRNGSVVLDSVAGGFTDLIFAESGAYTPIDLGLCPDALCSSVTTLFKGVTNSVLNTLLGTSEFAVNESGDASLMDQTFLFRFSDAIFDYVKVTEFGDRSVYTGDRLALDFVGFGGEGDGSGNTPSPIPGPAGLPLLASGLVLLGWVRRRKA